MNINPVAIFFVVFATAIGWIFGSPAIGLAVGSGLVFVSSLKG